MTGISEINDILCEHNCVYSVHFDALDDCSQYRIILNLGVDEKSGNHNISVTFNDVSNLKMNVNALGLVQFMHLRITPLDNGYDRVAYEIVDLEDGAISFMFHSYSTTDVN